MKDASTILQPGDVTTEMGKYFLAAANPIASPFVQQLSTFGTFFSEEDEDVIKVESQVEPTNSEKVIGDLVTSSSVKQESEFETLALRSEGDTTDHKVDKVEHVSKEKFISNSEATELQNVVNIQNVINIQPEKLTEPKVMMSELQTEAFSTDIKTRSTASSQTTIITTDTASTLTTTTATKAPTSPTAFAITTTAMPTSKRTTITITITRTTPTAKTNPTPTSTTISTTKTSVASTSGSTMALTTTTTTTPIYSTKLEEFQIELKSKDNSTKEFQIKKHSQQTDDQYQSQNEANYQSLRVQDEQRIQETDQSIGLSPNQSDYRSRLKQKLNESESAVDVKKFKKLLKIVEYDETENEILSQNEIEEETELDATSVETDKETEIVNNKVDKERNSHEIGSQDEIEDETEKDAETKSVNNYTERNAHEIGSQDEIEVKTELDAETEAQTETVNNYTERNGHEKPEYLNFESNSNLFESKEEENKLFFMEPENYPHNQKIKETNIAEAEKEKKVREKQTELKTSLLTEGQRNSLAEREKIVKSCSKEEEYVENKMTHPEKEKDTNTERERKVKSESDQRERTEGERKEKVQIYQVESVERSKDKFLSNEKSGGGGGLFPQNLAVSSLSESGTCKFCRKKLSNK